MTQIALVMGILITLGIGAYAYVFRRKARASRRWPKVHGVITSHDIKTYQGSGSGGTMPTYKPIVEYEYELAGIRYVSNQVEFRFSHIGSMDYDFIWQYVQGYRPGDKVRVYYNPRNPKESVINPGDHALKLAPLIYLVSFFAAGLIFFTGFILGNH